MKWQIYCMCLVLLAIGSNSQPIVEVEQGLLMGKTVTFSEHEYVNIDRELDVYEGVPFAESPGRFERPVMKEPWEGTYNATYVRPTCYQESVFVIKDQLEVSEDCLYLNIYVPHEVVNASVMVWIHGGAFREGLGSQLDYNGEPMSAIGDVIHINLNYRLGTFGYITTGDSNLPGNYGMLDQVEALKWIRSNIHAFGGDKDRVTVFGESAGAASVNYLLLSKLSAGLFQRAIMESGASLSSWGFQETDHGRDVAFKIGAALGCNATDTTILRQCLRDATTKELYDAGAALNFMSAPCIDDYFLDDSPLNLIKRHEFHNIPLMLGTNADEGTLMVLGLYPGYAARKDPPFISKDEVKGLIRWLQNGDNNPLFEDSIYQQYLDWSIQDQDNLDYFQPFVDINTDEAFAAPTDIVARAHAMAGNPVFYYEMTHVPTVSMFSTGIPGVNPTWLGCGHTEEISFVFGFPFSKVNNRMKLSGPEIELSVKMIRFCTEFSKTGTPSISSDVENEMYWPTFTIPELKYKILALNLTTDRALKSDNSQFWNDMVPKLKTFTGSLEEVENEWRKEFNYWKHQAMEEWWEAFNDYKDSS